MTKLLISHIQKVVQYDAGYGTSYEIHLKKKIFEKFKRFESSIHLIPRWMDTGVHIFGISKNKISKKNHIRTSRTVSSKIAAVYAIKKIKFTSTKDRARYKLEL